MEGRSWLYKAGVVTGGVIVALFMLLGVFNWLNSIGLPTGVVSFLLILVGIFSLATAGRKNYLASVFIMMVGLFLFADSIHLLGTGSAPWLWPLFIVLFGVIVMVFQTSKRPKQA